MTLTVIELNDAGVLAGRDGEVILESPGYAVMENNRIVTGSAAFASARLHPRSTVTRFWDRLGLEPVDSAGYGARTFADLAFEHLQTIWAELASKSDRIVLAVPGSFSREQLGLLLGMAREAAIPVAGLVDAAVAAASRAALDARPLVLDLQLHRIVLTELTAGKRLARRAVHENSRFGLVALRDAWADRIADAFVRATRFDPMHDAVTEQALHDAMPLWMSGLVADTEASLELQAGDRTHTVTVKQSSVVNAVETEYAQIGQLVASCTRPGEPVTLLLTARAQGLPGLRDTLARIPELRCVALDRDAAIVAAERQSGQIVSESDTLEFVTSLPVGRADIALDAPAGAAPRESLKPTHVLYAARAFVIDERPLAVGTREREGERSIRIAGSPEGVSRHHLSISESGGTVSVEDHSTYGSYLNGRRIDGRVAVSAGDRIRIGSPGGEELQLIVAVD